MIENFSILLVEDDDVAAESVLRGLRKIKENVKVVLAENGKVALDILKKRHPEKEMKTPFVVLLDLNMPVMSGFEFLDQIRADEKLSGSVVFILTTSDNDSDKARAYNNQVAGYMVKSSVGPQFSKLASLLEAYKEAIALNN